MHIAKREKTSISERLVWATSDVPYISAKDRSSPPSGRSLGARLRLLLALDTQFTKALQSNAAQLLSMSFVTGQVLLQQRSAMGHGGGAE